MKAYLASPEGREKYKQTYPILLAKHQVTDPQRCHKTAHDATVDRIERVDFTFPDFERWATTQRTDSDAPSA